MAELVADCPRCGAARITFDVRADQLLEHAPVRAHETFCVCRHCRRSTVFQLAEAPGSPLREVGLVQPDAALNPYVRIVGYVNIRDMLAERAPEDLPEDVAQVFQEGAACLAIGCFNASATMFRLCVDLATRNLLPADNANGLNRNVRQYLGHRLAWLFEHEYLPHRFRRLSTCIKDDGNDGAHQGTIGKEEAEDLLDFTRVLLQHIYTDPARITRAERRTADRRKEQED